MIFFFNSVTLQLRKKGPPSAADREEAERMKTEGNNLMRTEKFQEALSMYSKAIELDGSNPVFYCNRAAAHSKMNNHHLAIEDCQRAIDMDPSYSKAYGRMGLAHSSLNKHKEAVDNFKKALELEQRLQLPILARLAGEVDARPSGRHGQPIGELGQRGDDEQSAHDLANANEALKRGI